jgi:hypothetical protein
LGCPGRSKTLANVIAFRFRSRDESVMLGCGRQRR